MLGLCRVREAGAGAGHAVAGASPAAAADVVSVVGEPRGVHARAAADVEDTRRRGWQVAATEQRSGSLALDEAVASPSRVASSDP